MVHARTPVFHSNLVFSELVQSFETFGPFPTVTSFARASVELVAVIMFCLLMFLLSMRCELFTIRKSPVATFEVTCLHALIFVLLLLELGDVQARICLSKGLCENIDDFSPLEVLATSLCQHVFSIDEVFRIPQVCQNSCCLPGTEEWVGNNCSYARVSFNRIDVIKIMADKSLVLHESERAH